MASTYTLPTGDKLLPKPRVQIESSTTSNTNPPLRTKRVVRTPSQTSLDSKGTVLLRQAMPKYSFQTKKPTAVVVSTPSLPNPELVNQSKEKVEPTSTAAPNSRPVSKVDPLPGAAVTAGPTSIQTASNVNRNMPLMTKFPSLECLPFPDPLGSQIVSLQNQNGELQDENERLKKEMENMKRQLDVQFQVNSELKKLLVASVGDDLQFRVENLARDRAQLSTEIGTFAKRRTEDYEHIDKVSIQADMWRSKFLASRVMIDELASSKAYLSIVCQESQSALQQMLTERHEIRSNLMETYKILQQVRSAFDPLNSQKSMGVASTNSLDLARVNQRLTEAIRYRLLPSHVALDSVVNIDQWTDSLTLAESRANELLSKKIDPEDVQKQMSIALRDPSINVIDRFHPFTRFDNLTLNCCVQCQGEMFAI
ncbi:golgin-45-like [Mizuhopecten yessoensis]|uniref:Golgin-45 n=1 Tax=Mizuhopecten yessoensis TaxID=6573 RepID=A0A210R396_MIZYE|nr:golgin-45-like [Mizuhopecten yessoensis]XP_021368450.1 golgin-45-like [Mizuhopecten yessoensis]OWF55445.1 Golgin-45 [Mizuhopecten yessoensis]